MKKIKFIRGAGAGDNIGDVLIEFEANELQFIPQKGNSIHLNGSMWYIDYIQFHFDTKDVLIYLSE